MRFGAAFSPLGPVAGRSRGGERCSVAGCSGVWGLGCQMPPWRAGPRRIGQGATAIGRRTALHPTEPAEAVLAERGRKEAVGGRLSAAVATAPA